MTFRLAVALALAALALTSGAHAADRVSVNVDRSQIATKLGHKFVFRSTIANTGPGIASRLIAHLNVLSLRTGVYVDPEDWSSHRTRYLGPIPPGGSTTLTWRMEAVNSGSFGVYVAVLPQSGAARRPTTGPVVHVTVAQKKTLNSAGILPLVLGIPALLGLVWLFVHVRRGNRERRPG